MPGSFQWWDDEYQSREQHDAEFILRDGSGPIVVTAGCNPAETEEYYTVHDDHEAGPYVVTGPDDEVLAVFGDVADALAYAHGRFS